MYQILQNAVRPLLLLILFAAGCRTIPPAPPAADLHLPGPARPDAAALPVRLDLQAAKSAALRYNPDLEVTRARIRSVGARLREAGTRYAPVVGAGVSAVHSQDVPSSQSFLTGERFETYSPSLTFEWLAFDGYARQLGEHAAARDLGASEAVHDNARRLLLGAVSRAWYNAALARERMRITAADRDFNQRLLDDMRQQVEAEQASRTDANNFELRRNNADVQFINAERDYTLALTVLAELLGLPGADLSGRLDFDIADGELPEKSAPGLDELLDIARQQRADLEELRATMAALKARQAAAQAAKSPTVSVSGELGATSRDNVKFEGDERSGSLGVVATWELYTGGARQAAVDTAAADYEVAARQLQDRWQEIVGEIRRQRPVITAARRRLKLNRESVGLALQIRDDIERAWRAGAEPLTRLNEAQRDLNVAELNLAVVRAELLQARSDLDTATGSILD